MRNRALSMLHETTDTALHRIEYKSLTLIESLEMPGSFGKDGETR